MGYIEINYPNGTQVYLGLDNNQSAEVVLTCDSCNAPKLEFQGSSVQSDGLDLMWICDKCNSSNYDKSYLTKPKEEEKNE